MCRKCVILDLVPRGQAGEQTFENLGHRSSTCSFKLFPQVRSSDNIQVLRWLRALKTLGGASGLQEALTSSLAVRSSGDLTSSLEPRVPRHGGPARERLLASHSLSRTANFKSDPGTWPVRSGLATPPPELENETALRYERHRPRPPLGPRVSFDSP